MKTVTDDFIAAQRRPDAIGIRQVYYKKRYWNNTTKAYVWESSWTQIGEDEIVTVSPITWQLDTDVLNEYKVSNVTIVLDNSDNKYRPDNPAGFFKQDSSSPIYGYEPYWTKFQIKTGLRLPDGTDEVVTLFTGVLTDFIMNSREKTVEMSIQGLEAVLLNTKAEGIATVVTGENAGTGDGSTADFITDQVGVGGVSEVSVNGIKKVEGSDYSVSQLNEALLPAKVTFTSPPALSTTVRISYFYWPQSYTFDALVEALLDAAGITDYTVDPVIFENSVLNSQTYSSATDWDSWTKDGMESASSPGDLKIDWTDARFKEAKTWSESTSGWSGNSDGFDAWTSPGAVLEGDASTNFGLIPYNRLTNKIYRSVSGKHGTWEFTYDMTTNPTGAVLKMYFMSSASLFSVLTNASDATIRFSNSTSVDFPLGSGPSASVSRSGSHTVKFVFKPDSTLNIYWDGTLKISTTTTVSASPVLAFQLVANAHATVEISLISVPPNTAQVSAVSPAINWSSTPSAWGVFDHNEQEAGSDVTYQTRTGPNGVAWDAYVDVSPSGIPASDLDQYAQIKAIVDVDNTSTDGNVELEDVTIRSTSTGVTVTLPAFTGLSVYEAIQKLGEYTLYEFGFNPDESFFFRARSSDAAAVMDLTQSDYNSQISSFDSGYERVYGTVRITYNDITKEASDDGQFASSPNARVLERRFDFSPDDNIQIPATADIATGVAASIFKEVSRPKRRMKLITKFLPQLDLSDNVTVDLENNQPDQLWYHGDDTVYLGQEGINHWGGAQQLTNGLLAKIIGARYDSSRFTCEFDLEEILS